ncbi:uncharacterized protein [Lepeophtheirus salmonis]|uniref:uncharacterized protein n=1 Tax=Lepeophtheirus salmonis TaxID=72036 RepID=UPI001AE6ACB8|nr:histone-lysine N-methyltransferase SETD7-like [Lepeophtheirus salmonis]
MIAKRLLFLGLVIILIDSGKTEEPSTTLFNWINYIQSLPTPIYSPDPFDSKPCFDDVDEIQHWNEDGILSGVLSNGSVLQISTNDIDIKKASGNATLTNGDFEIDGYFTNGCFKGLVRYYRIYDTDYIGEGRKIVKALIGITYMKERGIPYSGSTWRFLRGTLEPDLFAYMIMSGENIDGARTPISSEDYKNMFSGGNVIMLYPDFQTAMQGKFYQGDLVEGKLVTIPEVIQNYEGLMEIVTSKPFGELYKRDVASHKKFSIQPFLKDPYEAKNCEIRRSIIENAGDGVFSKRFLKNGTAIGYFKGVKLREKDIEPITIWNVFTGSLDRSKYLIQYGENDEYLDVPEEYGKVSQYNATTAHKVNHSRKPNAGYFDCNHPRFGEVLCLYTQKDLVEGDELFVKYAITISRDTVDRMLKAGFLASRMYTGKSKDEMQKSFKPYVKMLTNFNNEHPIQEIIEDMLGFH